MKLIFALVLLAAVFIADAHRKKFHGGHRMEGHGGHKRKMKFGHRYMPCPGGVWKCSRNPCRLARCPANERAKCIPDYCGGCAAKFYHHGEPVDCSKVEAVSNTECPSLVPLVNCFINPCNSATCSRHPNAECKPNYCGGCNADFYVEGQKVECEEKAAKEPQCPNGRMVKCALNPCTLKKCKKHPEAKCQPNYCGGCQAEFYLGDEKVDCETEQETVSSTHSECPEGVKRHNCLVNPCQVTKCKPRFYTRCVPDYCGGCKAKFLSGYRQVSCD